MGLEARCTLTYRRRKDEGTARLESAELSFAGRSRLRIPFASISGADARGGDLLVHFDGETARFSLGREAGTWALKIRYPRPRIDKLGVKTSHRVSVIGLDDLDDPAFRGELEARTPHVSWRRRKAASDIIFFKTARAADLTRLGSLRGSMEQTGAIWVLWPKGTRLIREDDVRGAALRAGLVDVKVVSFSGALSALKLVIPLKDRA